MKKKHKPMESVQFVKYAR